MAIRKMTSKERFEAGLPNIEKVSNYPGHEEGRIYHGTIYTDRTERCPHDGDHAHTMEFGPRCAEYKCHKGDALYMETTHIGLVLRLGEHNWHDDSDFYAVVWNAEKGEPEKIEYATTRGWSYPNSAREDASPEVVAAWTAWSEKMNAARVAAEAVTEAKALRRGKRVVVVKGRKVEKGTEGEVFWIGTDNWNKVRIGIRDNAGKVHWTAGSNVVVKNWESFLPANHPAASDAPAPIGEE